MPAIPTRRCAAWRLLLSVAACALALSAATPPRSQGADAVSGADGDARRQGLELMGRVWKQAAPRLAPGAPLPRVRFWNDRMPLVGMTFTPGRFLATRRVDWPDWVNARFLGGDGAMRLMIIHEWAHYFQRPGLSASEAEGGAQLYARRAGPRIWAAVGLPTANLPFAADQYPHDMAAAKRRHDERWILQGQFRTRAALSGARPPAP